MLSTMLEAVQWLYDLIVELKMCWLLQCSFIFEQMEMMSLQGQELTNMDLLLQTRESKVGGLFLEKAAQIGG